MNAIRTTLALAAIASATTAHAVPRNTYGPAEEVIGVRYHVVGFDKGFKHDAARAQAFKKAMDECHSREGYMTDFQAGATQTVITIQNGVAEPAYATCRTNIVEPKREGVFLAVIPEARVDFAGGIRITATGALSQAYYAVINKAPQVCQAGGEQVKHVGIGFERAENQPPGTMVATADVTCSPAVRRQ
ncbi:hypothetical protein [Luteibacter aegosomatissinici]|uniref:hypothetical protein n=1 Tax=Luteibacter aegosomatissinici TaxID=2911539 RepID=UPI001FFA59A6|nr:hypothetical protein [Luteibacter aegosomatissinici]UPG93976.1 hypothetical protein L2Y97_19445 [Luteibacter aegosomatissinici]